ELGSPPRLGRTRRPLRAVVRPVVEEGMPVERMDMHRLQDLVRLHRLGVGARTVARRLRMSPNTERQYRRALAAHGLLAGDATALPELTTLREAVVTALPPKTPPQQVSSLARWTATITPWLAEGATPTAISDRLR